MLLDWTELLILAAEFSRVGFFQRLDSKADGLIVLVHFRVFGYFGRLYGAETHQVFLMTDLLCCFLGAAEVGGVCFAAKNHVCHL